MADDPFSHPTILSKIEAGKLGILAKWQEWIANPTEGNTETKILEAAVAVFDLYGETYLPLVRDRPTHNDFDEALRAAGALVVKQAESVISYRREQIKKYPRQDVSLEIRLDQLLLEIEGMIQARRTSWRARSLERLLEGSSDLQLQQANDAPADAIDHADRACASERQSALLKYKNECKSHGVRVTDLMIARAASPTWNDRTPITRWKSCDKRSTAAEDAKIRAVFKRKPHLP
jgi:hypothetical protein